jgi:hypothetical protein
MPWTRARSISCHRDRQAGGARCHRHAHAGVSATKDQHIEFSVCIARPLRVAAILPKAGRPAEGYFAFTLDVIESITVEAIAN